MNTKIVCFCGVIVLSQLRYSPKTDWDSQTLSQQVVPRDYQTASPNVHPWAYMKIISSFWVFVISKIQFYLLKVVEKHLILHVSIAIEMDTIENIHAEWWILLHMKCCICSNPNRRKQHVCNPRMIILFDKNQSDRQRGHCCFIYCKK